MATNTKSTFKFSKSSITQNGEATLITITRGTGAYANKLSHGYSNGSPFFTWSSATTTTHTYAWGPSATALEKFWEEVPTQKTRLVDVYLDSYTSDGTKIGRDIHALTVTLSETTGKPTLSEFAITDSNSTTNGWGVIIPGKSTLIEKHTATAKYGASIVDTATTYYYGDSEYGNLDALVASLPATETVTEFEIGCKVKDSRGFTETSTVSKNVVTYKAPTIDTFEVVRCDDDGKESESGTKAKFTVKGSWSPVKVGSTCKNPATFKIGYKTYADESYIYIDIPVSDGTINFEKITSQILDHPIHQARFDADTDYYFSVSLADTFETYSQVDMPFSNSQSILYVSDDGSEIVFGPETGSNLHLSSEGMEIRQRTSRLASYGKEMKLYDEDGSVMFNASKDYDSESLEGVMTKQTVEQFGVVTLDDAKIGSDVSWKAIVAGNTVGSGTFTAGTDFDNGVIKYKAMDNSVITSGPTQMIYTFTYTWYKSSGAKVDVLGKVKTRIETPHDNGYTTDQYGNIVHKAEGGSTDTWNICNSEGTSKFSVNFENGETKANLKYNVLWSGAKYPVAEEVSLSGKVSEQNSGVVLVFSGYTTSTSTANDSDWYYFFVPKWHVLFHNGGGIHFPVGTRATVAHKYIYLYDDKFKGHADNSSSSLSTWGQTQDNRRFVLRAIIGV